MGRSEATELRCARLGAQGLVDRRATDVDEVVRHLLAVQAQDLRAATLAVRARTTGLTRADVDEALTVRRSLVVSWLHRGTLHLVAAEDYWWLHALMAPRIVTGNTRRLRQEGVSAIQAARGVEVVADAVRSLGPQTRSQLQRHLDEAGVPTAGQALVHVLVAASIAGLVVRGPMVGRHHAFVDPASWIGPPQPVDPEASLARLARRYLASHGPADAGDLAKWSGLPLGAARRGFAAIADELAPFGGGLSRLADHPPTADLPAPRLLGGFDPILHGWASRELFVGAHQGIVTTNGVFRPTALVDGRTTATWTLNAGVLRLRPLEPLRTASRRALERDAGDVQRYLGLPEIGLVVP